MTDWQILREVKGFPQLLDRLLTTGLEVVKFAANNWPIGHHRQRTAATEKTICEDLREDKLNCNLY